ncbi:MAG: TonB family protein [Cyclobacteriaceae bacterium]|nr:TonB family protein [Cyclobacteriaceae bacterium]
MKRNIDHIDLKRHLTQQELVEYSKGLLGNEEMYRLELHLNECELCSDALEGIEQIKAPGDLINSINEVIKPQKKEMSIPRSYLAIAASIVLVAAIGFTFWVLNPLDNEKSLAVNTTKEKSEEKEQPKNQLELMTDTLSGKQEIASIPDEEEVEESFDKGAEKKPAVTPTPTQPAQKDLTPNEKTEQAKPKAEQEQFADAEMQLKEDINVAQTENDLSADEADQGMAAPTAAQEQVNSQPMRAKKALSNESLSEPMEDRSEPEPMGGASNYKTYLENNIIYPEAATENKVKGNVVLDVAIAANGTIKSITVVKGLGYGCDEEAKRLVLTGPQWLPAVTDGTPVEAHIELKVRFRP